MSDDDYENESSYSSGLEETYDSQSSDGSQKDPRDFKYGDEEFEEKEDDTDYVDDAGDQKYKFATKYTFSAKKRKRENADTNKKDADRRVRTKIEIHRDMVVRNSKKKAKLLMTSYDGSDDDSDGYAGEDIKQLSDILVNHFPSEIKLDTSPPVLVVNPNMNAIYTTAPSAIVSLLTPYHICARTGAFKRSTNKPSIDSIQLKRDIMKFNTVDAVVMHYFHTLVRTYVMQLHERQVQVMLCGENAVKKETPEEHERRNAHIVMAGILLFYLKQLGRITIEEAIKYEETVFKETFYYSKFESVLAKAIAIQNY